MGIVTAAGIVSVLFGAVWFAVPGPPAEERRSVGVASILVGVVLVALGLL